MFGIGTSELLLILLILVMLFGASRLPSLAWSIGTSVKELRKGMQDDEPVKKSEEESTSIT